MKIKLLERVAVYGPGVVWDHPWASQARKLIRDGKALAVEPCDLHLNPPAAGDEADPDDDPVTPAAGGPPAAAKKKRKRG